MKVAFVVPELPSSTGAASAMDRLGPSSSSIVPIPSGSSRLPSLGLDNVRLKVSSISSIVSAVVWTVIVPLVWPAGIESVPVRGV